MNSDPHSKFCKFLVSVMSGTSDFVFVDKLIFFFFDKNILEEKNYTVNLTYLVILFYFILLGQNFCQIFYIQILKNKKPWSWLTNY